ATGDISVQVSGGTADVGFTMNGASSLETVAATNEPPGVSHNITITTDQDIQVFGAIDALVSGSDVTLTSNEMILIDGLVKADDQLNLTGGTDETGVGLMVQPLTFKLDANDN